MKRRFWTMILVLGLVFWGVGCSGTRPDNTIKIASKPMAEQYVLTEMMKILIEENSDLNVEITKGIAGGTSNIMPALEKGDFDLYPEYTGTGWEFVLKKDEKLSSSEMFAQLNQEYKTQYQLEWLNLYGFDNTYALAIPNDFAQENNIKTMSDLALFTDQLTFGAEYDFFEREDGYNAMNQAYGYNFKDRAEMDIGLRYQAIKDGKIQAVDVFTTDGQLMTAELTVLEDDKQFFPIYDCGTVIRQQTLEDHPELREILGKMTGLISAEDMIKMNYEVETNNRNEQDVAREFLESKGLLS